jgi:hypothetical protein
MAPQVHHTTKQESRPQRSPPRTIYQATKRTTHILEGWGDSTYTLVSWRQGFRHPTRKECMSRFSQIHSEPTWSPNSM